MILTILLVWTVQCFHVSCQDFDRKDPNLPCDLERFCSLIEYTDYKCYRFKSIFELNFTNCDSHPAIFIHLQFPKETILESSYVVELLYFFNKFEESHLAFFLGSLAGIDLGIFSNFNYSSRNVDLVFFMGRFDLFYKKEHILETNKCSEKTYSVLLNQQGNNVLGYFQSISLNQVSIQQKICKWMFQNLTLAKFGIEQTFFEFEIDSTSNDSLSLGANIDHVTFDHLSKLELNVKRFDPEIFKNLTYLEIYRVSLYKIQPDLFKERFLSIKYITLDLNNLKGYLHSIESLSWMNYLNSNQTPVNLSNLTQYARNNQSQDIFQYLKDKIIQVVIRATSDLDPVSHKKLYYPYEYYDFPGEDFCLYIKVPMERLVFVQIQNLANMSCTVAWLYRFEHLYSKIGLSPLNVTNNCDFAHLIAQCQIANAVTYQRDTYILYLDISNGIRDVKTILTNFYFRPIFSTIGFVTNLLCLVTIWYNHYRRRAIQSDKNSQEIVLLDQSLYKYICLNSILNMLYTLLHLVDSLIPCVALHPISTLYVESDNCFVRDIWIGTFDHILELMSNFSYLQITLNRYLLVGKDHSEFLIKISKIKLKKFIGYGLIVAVALSSILYFQETLFVDYDQFQPPLCNNAYADDNACASGNIYYQDQYYHYYREIHDFLYHELPVKLKNLPVITGFTFLHDIVSYFLFCLFSLILDILTVKKLHDTLLEKEKVKGKLDKRKNRESERRSIIMVVANSIVNFVLRAPELLTVIFYNMTISKGDYFYKLLCFNFESCLILFGISKVFYIMSLCFNLIFYVKFNSLFRCSFLKLVESIKCGKCQKAGSK